MEDGNHSLYGFLAACSIQISQDYSIHPPFPDLDGKAVMIKTYSKIASPYQRLGSYGFLHSRELFHDETEAALYPFLETSWRGRVVWHQNNRHVSWPGSGTEHPTSLLLCCSHLNVTSVSPSAWDSTGDVYNAGEDNMLQWYLLLLKPLYLRGKTTKIIKYTALHGQMKAAKVGF